uniref:Uncharacterized protein n=1 Tax=Pithovirus LCPAC401 TaxID=2506595 RepID=A0A481ZBI2_9VIRU|nr:MAG: hypothetical protein LCPAC401_03400 [Pithovirus LCPAC401]
MAFIYVKKWPGRIFICYSDHYTGVYKRIGKKNGYLHNNDNLLVGSTIQEDHNVFYIPGSRSPYYIYVDWISGIAHQTFKISTFSGSLNTWINELRANVLEYIIINWKKLFKTIAEKNIKILSVTCNDVHNVSSMITVKKIEFIFIYCNDTIFYFFSHIHDVDRKEYKCDRNNSLLEGYEWNSLYIVKKTPERIEMKWCQILD